MASPFLSSFLHEDHLEEMIETPMSLADRNLEIVH